MEMIKKEFIEHMYTYIYIAVLYIIILRYVIDDDVDNNVTIILL